MTDASATGQAESLTSDGGTRELETELGLLDMPYEVIVKIMCHLSPEELASCMLAHSKFWESTKGKSFKNMYIRTQLRLINDQDVKYDILPESFSPLVELWYFASAALAKHNARRQNLHRPVLGKSYNFLSLAIFKHLYQTWLVQAGCINIWDPDSRRMARYDPETGESCSASATQEIIPTTKEIARSCGAIFDEHLPDLPIYVTQFMTKLFLVAPTFLERSLFMRHLSLRKGNPVKLGHDRKFFSDFRAGNFPASFKPHYSLEVVSDELTDDDVYNAILLLFCPDTCVFWVGTVSEVPQYVAANTNELKVINTKISLTSLREQLNGLDWDLQQALTAEDVDTNFLQQKFYPGTCFMIHRRKRQQLCNSLELMIRYMARKVHTHLSTISFDPSSKLCEADNLPQLQLLKSDYGVDFSVYNKKSNPCKDIWTLKRCRKAEEFDLRGLACETCDHFAKNIRDRLIDDREMDSKYFLKNIHAHIITCAACMKRYYFRVGPGEMKRSVGLAGLSPSLPTFISFDIMPYHLISNAFDKVEIALKILGDLEH